MYFICLCLGLTGSTLKVQAGKMSTFWIVFTPQTEQKRYFYYDILSVPVCIHFLLISTLNSKFFSSFYKNNREQTVPENDLTLAGDNQLYPVSCYVCWAKVRASWDSLKHSVQLDINTSLTSVSCWSVLYAAMYCFATMFCTVLCCSDCGVVLVLVLGWFLSPW